MKLKIFLLALIAALIVYSCSTDRDDEKSPNIPESKMKIENIKETNREESSTASDSTVIFTPMTTSPTVGLEPQPENPDPNEGDDPKNVPPRK